MLIDLTGKELHTLYLKVRHTTYRSEGWVTTYSRDRIVFEKIANLSNYEINKILGKNND